jgi:archaellum component FlaC
MTAEKEQTKADDTETAADENEKESEQEILTRELEASKSTIGKLEQALATRDREIDGLKSSLSELKTESEGLSENLARTIAAYREITLQANPGVLAELITGNSVDEINDSLRNARVLVDKVRQEIETETTQTRIPAGAPSRSAQDIASLSPREKIQRALGGTPS